MHIDFLISADAYEINFTAVLLADERIISAPSHFPIDYIFQRTCNHPVFIPHYGINQRQVADEILLVGLQQFFSLDVITWHTLEDECSLQGIQIIIYGIDVHFSLLALEVVGNILGIEPVADIVKHEAYYPFQQFHITDTVSLYGIA